MSYQDYVRNMETYLSRFKDEFSQAAGQEELLIQSEKVSAGKLDVQARNIQTGSLNISLPTHKLIYTDDSCKQLIEGARSDKISFSAAKEVIFEIVENDQPLPSNLKSFLKEILINDFKPSLRRGASGRPGIFKQHRIGMAVFKLYNEGYHPISRNDTSEPISACDIVAEALTNLGERTSYDTVRKAWNMIQKRGGL